MYECVNSVGLDTTLQLGQYTRGDLLQEQSDLVFDWFIFLFDNNNNNNDLILI